MAPKRRTEVVMTGAAALTVEPGASIAPARWAGKEARLARMDRLCALALVACDGALVDAALSPTAAEWDGERTAIVFGSAFGCHATNEDYYRGFVREGAAGASPRLFAYTLPSSPVGEMSIHYGVRGPTLVMATAWPVGWTRSSRAWRSWPKGAPIACWCAPPKWRRRFCRAFSKARRSSTRRQRSSSSARATPAHAGRLRAAGSPAPLRGSATTSPPRRSPPPRLRRARRAGSRRSPARSAPRRWSRSRASSPPARATHSRSSLPVTTVAPPGRRRGDLMADLRS